MMKFSGLMVGEFAQIRKLHCVMKPRYGAAKRPYEDSFSTSHAPCRACCKAAWNLALRDGTGFALWPLEPAPPIMKRAS
jgi:hypothetical protein